MINMLLGNAFLDVLKNEWLGIVASAFILVSFLFTKQTVIRVINMVGCVVFVVYGLLLPTYSTAFMNGALFIVHVVYLIKDGIARKKAQSGQDKVEGTADQQDNAQAAEGATKEYADTDVIKTEPKADRSEE